MFATHGRPPYASSTGVRAALSILAILVLRRAGATRCVPCGRTVTWGPEEADVGFICQEGFPTAPLRHPYTCTVAFKVPRTYNLTFHLHEIYNWDLNIEVCNQSYNKSRRYAKDEEHWKDNCVALSPEDSMLEVRGDVYLNVTTKRQPRRDVHLLHHDYYTGRHGFNFTYELIRERPVIGNLEYSNINSCSYNGVPVLHGTHSETFNFSCECPEGVTGAQCQWGGVCTSERATELCSQHGTCSHSAGVSACACEREYFGPACQFHYLTIPTNSVDCGGQMNCEQNCHMLLSGGKTYTYCSCSVGYTLVGETRCQPTEEWDLSVTVKSSKGHLSQEEIKNKTLEVFSRADPGGNATKNLTIITKKRKAEIEVSVTEKNARERLSRKDLWQHTFHLKSVSINALPRLSVGPISAEFPEKQKRLELRCPVYGGPDLQVSWFKDGIPIYSHNASSCSYEDMTSLLYIKAEKDDVAHRCTFILSISPLEQMDHGTFSCQVVDRGYNLTQTVVVGMNASLQVEVTPFVHSVYPSSDTILDCKTKNRQWFDGDHYTAEWTVLPEDGYSSFKENVIFRSGFRIYISNIMKPLNVTCKVTEKKGVMYLPGEKTQDIAQDTVEVHVLDKPACRQVSQYKVLWKSVPVGKRDVEKCPEKFLGRTSRFCSPLPTPSPLPPQWETPDFSKCLYKPLRSIKTPLTLYKRGYRTLSGGVDELTKDFLKILQERKTPLLPGEGASLLQILEMLQEAGKEMRAVIPQELFFDIVHEIIKDHGSLTLMDVCKMNIPVRMYLSAGLDVLSQGGEVTRLPHFVAKREVITGDQVFEMEGSYSSTDNSLGAPTVQVKLEEPGVRQTNSLTQPRTQVRVFDFVLAVGAVAYLNPSLAMDYNWETDDSPVKLAGPLVEIAWSVFKNSSGSFSTAESSTPVASTSQRLPFVTWLHYPSCPRMANWNLRCGQAQPNKDDIRWDFSMCSIENDGRQTDTGCVCRCRGKGLFGLVLVNVTSEEAEQADGPGNYNYVTGISCIVSCLLLLLCLLLQLPRWEHSHVQLRVTKCLALAGFNGIFAAVVLWPVARDEYLLVLVAASMCYVFCMGTGVSHQMLLHHRLSVSPYKGCLSPLRVSNIMIVLLTIVSGTLIWVVHSVCQYKLEAPWLSLGPSWPLTALTVGILFALTFLWATVAGHNLCQLTALIDESNNYVTVRDSIGQQVVVLVGDWLVLVASLVYSHYIGRYFFSFATVAQSILMLIVSRQEDVHLACPCRLVCCFDVRYCRKSSQSEVGNGSPMAYCLTSTSTPGETVGHFKYYKADGAEDYFRRDSAPCKRPPRIPERDSLPRRPSLPSRVPLYVRRGSQGGGPILSRPRNTFLVRGADLLRGEDYTEDQQDGLLRSSSLTSEEKVSGRMRNHLLTKNQGIVRDFPLELLKLPGGGTSRGRTGPTRDPDGRYLDMTVSHYKGGAEGPRQDAVTGQRYMNVGKDTIPAAEKMRLQCRNGGSRVSQAKGSFRLPNGGQRPVQHKSIKSPAIEQADGATHHYLPMKVNAHAIQPNGRRPTEGKSESAKEYLLADNAQVGHRSNGILPKDLALE